MGKPENVVSVCWKPSIPSQISVVNLVSYSGKLGERFLKSRFSPSYHLFIYLLIVFLIFWMFRNNTAERRICNERKGLTGNVLVEELRTHSDGFTSIAPTHLVIYINFPPLFLSSFVLFCCSLSFSVSFFFGSRESLLVRFVFRVFTSNVTCHGVLL